MENVVPHPRNRLSASDPVTEDIAAIMFAERHKDELRFCHSRGRWLRWDGSIWREDQTHVAFHFARLLTRELSAAGSGKEIAAASKAAFCGGVERFCKVDPLFARTSADWDKDPLLVGTPGGTLDLRTGVMREADPADGITKALSVAPADAADCPIWLRFLSDTTGDDQALIRFLQQWMGYALSGIVSEHALVFIYGGGGNGKSVWLNTLTGILGDYATTASMETFTASGGDRHPTDLAMLQGARLVTASETEQGRAWAESRIKQMTGGDPISARFMRMDFFSYRPQFKLTIVGNHKPVLNHVDEAAKRRVNIVPFTRVPTVPDRQLEEKLKAEHPSILRWAILGFLDWQANGLVRPNVVKSATEAYFSDQDLFGQWPEDECETDLGNTHKWETAAELFAAWRGYSDKSADPATKKAFSAEMQRRGYEPYRGAARTYRFIQFKRPHKSRGDDA